jgi:Uma2 family endonuclease
MALVLERPTFTEPDPDVDEFFRELSERAPNRKVELIDGRIVVREVPTTEHADIIFRLLLQLIPVITERGWRIWNDVALFLGPQLARYRPDLLVVPPDPKRWGDDHVHGEDTVLVAEVVSRSSAHDDHETKPRGCALGKVPLYLVIDGFTGRVRLLSRPGGRGYDQEVAVKLGAPLDLPEPWIFTLDTSLLVP